MDVHSFFPFRSPTTCGQQKSLPWIRQQKLENVPGVSETLDWGRALVVLHQDHLDPEIVSETLGIVFKDRNDVRQVRESLSDFLERLGVQAKAIPEAAAVIRESA